MIVVEEQTTVHPDSPIGKLQAQLEAARVAPEPVRADLARLQDEAIKLDAWLDVADLDTVDVADWVIKWGKRELLGRVIAKRQQRLAALEAARATLEEESQPLFEAWQKHLTELETLRDATHQHTRTLPLYLVEERTAALQQWLREMTQAPVQPAKGKWRRATAEQPAAVATRMEEED